MKPTWEGWPAVYASQSGSTDVTSYSDCLYAGRWGEHDDVTWYDFQEYNEEENIIPIPWNHCSTVVEENLEFVTRLGLYSAGAKLWHSTDTRPDEPIETIWYPVEYPN